MLARLFVLLAALALAAAARDAALSEQRAAALRPLLPGVVLRPGLTRAANDDACDICSGAIKSLEEYISDPQTQASVAKYLQKQVCDQLPQSMVDTCRMEIPLLVNMVIAMARQSVPPASICAYMGLCAPSTPSLRAHLAQANGLSSPFDCPACKMVVQLAVARLEDPQLRQQMRSDIEAACDTMPPEGQARCHEHVAALFKALDDLLRDIDPQGVCRLALFCGSALQARPAPVSLLALQEAAARLAATPATPAPGRLQDACDSCKTIVTEAAAIISDPTTQREILDYAKEGCSVFADFKEQCETYVDIYGPLVLNMALQYLQPLPLCTRMGYCSGPAPPAA